ncbi:cytidylate kinase [Pyrolobus fumarii 1A]|uniref:Cytidylate kinase n=1 Tax=Pyrolobus fumarii (strain DSM 11204 / 1A) TaxID=694429 RepID=G0ECH2_PYRF1|nr:AAA family ATPase [Pyrolobus fumarii]AEM39542.1 cytidylate kinase [Pyrolobus fumarii 1A]
MASRRGPVIAVSGPPGSGKTTYARRLAEDLGLEFYSAGMFFRELAKKRGLTLLELNQLAAKDPSIDLEIDRMTYEVGLRGNVVVEGHLVAWVLRDIADVKIYVTAPLDVRVNRIAARDGVDVSVALRETIERENVHRRRFLAYYGIDINDLSIFDLVVDTSKLGIEEVYRVIREFVTLVLSRSR